MKIAVALVALCAAHASAQRTALVPAMELTYESNGVRSKPWRVDSVVGAIALGGKTGCLRVRYAPSNPTAAPDIRVTCEAEGTLFAWDTVRSAWKPSRPIAPHDSLVTRTAANAYHYVTNGEAEDVIDGFRLRVILTTMTTIDTAGRTLRRLRERFAPEIGTATWGVFESRDTTATGGWKTTQEFRLVAIKAGAR